MPNPWQSQTRKDIDGITHRPRPRAGHLFVAPAPRTKLTFSQAELCASMAMTNALSGMSSAAARSLAQAMSQLVTDHVEDDPPDSLQFLDSVAQLADNARTFFSSCIGTGIADTYALALGYRFRCNSRELIASGRAGDFVYDGPPVPANEAVMIEAKGSLQANLNTAAFWRTVDQGYVGQIEPHIGSTWTLRDGQVLTIVHGYAVGCAAQVPLVDAIGHVVETASPGAGTGGSDDRRTNAQIAIGNYLGVATLMGDEVLQDSLANARRGVRLDDRGRSLQTRTITWRGERFVMFDDEEKQGRRRRDATDAYLFRMPPPRFALWEPMFRALQAHLATLPTEWELPAVPAALRSGDFNDGGAVLPDGSALLPPWFQEETDDRVTPQSAPLVPGLDELNRAAFEKLKAIRRERKLGQLDELQEKPTFGAKFTE